MSSGHVIVGVDASPASKAALRWAADHAVARGLSLEAVAVWEIPATFGWVGEEDLDPTEAARRGLESVVAEVVGTTPEVEITVARGHAALVLVEASERADLLVVGSRGMGGFAGLLLGSVSQHCVQHAHCPVVVVRGERGGQS
ncbi:universal stress protein [Longivirga aurantiaca]|uniref:Universal stress protein n=1 Tax=Longivirga aurantiaca TaxID=1837743 RepID=A0ABW1T2I2_9ACTN